MDALRHTPPAKRFVAASCQSKIYKFSNFIAKIHINSLGVLNACKHSAAAGSASKRFLLFRTVGFILLALGICIRMIWGKIENYKDAEE
jgi:hypothetical protein